jgi:hypothetical protein
MSTLTNAAENLALDWLNNVGTPTRPGTLHVALATAASNLETPTWTEVTNANGYARQSITFGAAASGSASNSGTITFPAATGSAWGTVTHVAITTSATHGAGTVVWIGALTASKTVAVGDQLVFNVGSIVATMD